MKTIITKLLILAAMLLASANIYAYDFKVDGIYYNIISSTEKTVEVTSGDNEYSGNVVIPEQVSYNNDIYSVTTIGDYAFYGCSGLTSVTIPNSVTSIGNYAFYDCSGLTSVTIPNSVTSIGDSAFQHCTNIKELVIEDGEEILELGYNIHPNSADHDGLFYDCPLKTVYLGRNLSYYKWYNYGYSPFCNTPITSLTISNSVTSIDYALFRGCTMLTSVTIPESVTSIGDYAFYGCNGLTSVTIPNSVISIGDDAFYGCSGLTSVTIPNSVTSIGDSAFGNCSNIKELVIEDGEEILKLGYNYYISSGSEGLFYDCPLETVYLGRDLSYDSGYDYGYSPFYNTPIKKLTIGNSVTLIGDSAFRGCRRLTSVTIPNSVTSIGDSAFESCSGLTSVTIPNSVTTISDYAFNRCDNLISVTMGTGVLSIGESAFDYTDLIKTIWLPNTPPDGYENVKSKCNYVANESYTRLSNKTVYPYLSSMFETDGLKYVPVSPSERTCDAIDCSYDNTADIVIGKTISYQGIEMTLLDVKDYLCYSNDSIKTLSIDGYEGNIGDMAFANCENLGGIEIPNTVTGIGSGCFQNCSSLAYAIIGSGVKELPKDCFRECSSLPEIVIPATVESVGNNVFYYCTSLARVDIEDRQSELSLGYNSDYSSSDQKPLFSDCPLDSVYIGGNISYATGSNRGYSPFYRNTSLRAVKITDQETEISENEFYGCTGLTTVELGDGIENIGNYAFSGCSALDSFSFGHSVTAIGEEAFSDCTAMTRLQSRAEMPPVCGNQALDDINKWTCELFVPAKSLDAYKAAEQWKEFFFITGEDYDKPGSVEDAVSENGGVSVATYRDSIEIIGADDAVITVCNTNGQLVYSGTETVINVPSKGIYIVRVSGQTFKVIL